MNPAAQLSQLAFRGISLSERADGLELGGRR
jgi:hypothetical protein